MEPRLSPEPITDGAQLVVELKKSGTGAAKLDVAREVLRAGRDAGRPATAADVTHALEVAFGPDHGTVKKARALSATGRLAGPELAADIEDELAGVAVAAPDAESVALPGLAPPIAGGPGGAPKEQGDDPRHTTDKPPAPAAAAPAGTESPGVRTQDAANKRK